MGMGTPEILVILLLAFLLLGPERMINAAKTVGKYVGEMRRMASEIPELTLDETERGGYEQGPIVHRGGGPNPSVRARSDNASGVEGAPTDAADSGQAEPDPDGPVPFSPRRPASNTDTQGAPESPERRGERQDGRQDAP